MQGKFAERVFIYRKRAGLSRENLAQRIPCSPALVQQWEQDVKHPTDVMILRCAQILDCTPNDLLGVDEEA